MYKGILYALLALAATSPRVSVDAKPRVFYPGATVIVTCTVPRAAENRRVFGIIEGYTSSSRQLDGDQAPITTRFTFAHVGCDAEAASCVLQTNSGQEFVARTGPFAMPGCDGE